mgnify:CR=1 FL=1
MTADTYLQLPKRTTVGILLAFVALLVVPMGYSYMWLDSIRHNHFLATYTALLLRLFIVVNTGMSIVLTICVYAMNHISKIVNNEDYHEKAVGLIAILAIVAICSGMGICYVCVPDDYIKPNELTKEAIWHIHMLIRVCVMSTLSCLIVDVILCACILKNAKQVQS